MSDSTTRVVPLEVLGIQQLEAERIAMVARIQNIDAQLSQRRADLDYFRLDCFAEGFRGKQRYFAAAAEFNEWKAKAVGAKRHCNKRLAEVKALLRERNADRVEAHDREGYHRLRSAVRAHRQTTLAEDYEPTPADLVLWSALSQEIDLCDA